MIVQEIKLTDIIVEDRDRTDVSHTEDIESTLDGEIGQIQCIAVKQLPDNKYRLLAGGRRLAAHIKKKRPTIFAHIYPDTLSEEDMIAIEIIENLARQNLTWQEECRGVLRLHRLFTSRAQAENKDATWSIKKTAEQLGIHYDTAQKTLSLAKSTEKFPNLLKADSKKKALNAQAKIIEFALVEEKGKRARARIATDQSEHDTTVESPTKGEETKDSKRAKRIATLRRNLLKSYITGDFFDVVKGIPDEQFDIVDFDPDYAIEHVGGKFNSNANEASQSLIMQDYVGVSPDADTYEAYLTKALKEVVRVMKPNAWLIIWFSNQSWYTETANVLEKVGLKFTKRPAIWFKDVEGKASQAPEIYLGPAYETFFYARKGDARIINRGKGDVFSCKTLHPKERWHPTQKPVPLMQDILSTFSLPNHSLLCPHAGSGTSLMAGSNLGLKVLGIEISKAQSEKFAVQVERWEPQEEV